MFKVKVDVALNDRSHEEFVAELLDGLDPADVSVTQTGSFVAGGNPEYEIAAANYGTFTLALLRYASAPKWLWNEMAGVVADVVELP